jgi:hypothetical protein
MPDRLATAVALAATLTVGAASARAERGATGASTGADADSGKVPAPSPPAPAAERHFRLGVVVGLLTPIGELGFELQRDVAPHLSLSGGIGAGLSGPQVALMPRVHAGEGGFRAYMGEGLSGGRFDPQELCWQSCEDEEPPFVVWANTEFGLEFASDTAFFRLFAGAGIVVSGDVGDSEDHPALPYGGIVLGARR